MKDSLDVFHFIRGPFYQAQPFVEMGYRKAGGFPQGRRPSRSSVQSPSRSFVQSPSRSLCKAIETYQFEND